jgi:hypothetical protein
MKMKMRTMPLVLVGILALVGVANHLQAVGSKCSSAKEKATGKKASCKLSVQSKATSSGDPVDSVKLAKCEAKFSKAFAKADAKGDCLGPTGDTAPIEAKVDAFVDDANTEITTGGPVPSKCQGVKLKTAGKKAKCLLGVDAKAVAKAAPVDGTKIQKCKDKFSKSSVNAEGKGDCGGAAGDTATIEAKVDAFADDADAELTTPTTTTTVTTTTVTTTTVTTTTVTTTTVTTTTVTTTTTTIPTTTTTTITTTTTTTTAAPTTTTTHTTTTTTSTTTTHTTTTTTSSTTTTTGRLGFTVTPGTTSCGSGGLVTPPAAPTSGNIDSDTSCTTSISPLGLGCLYFGGGMATVVAGGAIPDGSTSFLTDTNGTLTFSNGTNSDNCTRGAGPGKHCINNNSTPACTTDVNCGGAAGSCALDANCSFGPPLPIVSPPPFAALTTCVLNVVQSNASGTVNHTNGDSTINLPLSSRVYITGNTASPCPKCLSGHCDPTWKTNTSTTSPDTNAVCTAVGTRMTTNQCRPSLPGFQAPLPVSLNPLTTGTTSLTSASGNFCPQNNPGAFGQGGAQCITQTGMNAGTSLLDHLPHNSHLVSVFCIPSTGNAAVDGVADLPGPGAFSLNGNSQL